MRGTRVRRQKPLGRAAALAVAVAALVLVAPAAAWGSGATFALKPAVPTKTGYFVLKGQPGQTVRGAVRVLNVGTAPGRSGLYSVDATTGQTSGAVYRSRQEPRRDVGAWIKLAKSSVTLAPGQSQVVSFSIRIPAGAATGQHLGGIVAQRSTGKSGSSTSGGGGGGGFKVRIQELSVLAVQVNVPGPERASMTLTGIEVGRQPGHQSVLVGIGNTGNVLTKGSGTLRIVAKGGRVAQRSSFNLDTFVPGSHIDFPVYIQGKALNPGSYRGTVSISYRGHDLTRVFPFTITNAQTAQVFGAPAAQQTPLDSSSDPTLLYVLIAVSALSLGAAFYFWRQRRPA
jgi:WxL Interacting Protein, peptidoglycan binding domain/WxL Interacting Protein, host binding domain